MQESFPIRSLPISDHGLSSIGKIKMAMKVKDEYDHSKKIGNKGCLIKHFALTTAVKLVAENMQSFPSFSYLDVHSGRGEYDLPGSGGEWKHGIGKFARCRDTLKKDKDLKYFYDVHSLADLEKEKKYWGSSGIVLNVLNDLGIRDRKFILCDTEPSVCDDLRKQFQDVAVEVLCTDGYEKAHITDDMDLIFIDPPNISPGDHLKPFCGLIKHCIHEKKQFISWNLLNGDTANKTMSSECREISEFAKRKGIPSITIRWTKGWSGQICGCQMLFSVLQGNTVTNACNALIKLMDWEISE